MQAMKIDAENVEEVIRCAKGIGWDLSHLPYTIEEYASYGSETYLTTDGNGATGNLVYNTITPEALFEEWRFSYEEVPNKFVQMERTKPYTQAQIRGRCDSITPIPTDEELHTMFVERKDVTAELRRRSIEAHKVRRAGPEVVKRAAMTLCICGTDGDRDCRSYGCDPECPVC